MTSQSREITSEWEGLKGRIGGWYLNSFLRRLAEIFLLGDLRTRFLQTASAFLAGDEIVLDVGAGSGYFGLPIAGKLQKGKVICIDLSAQMLGQLRRRAERERVSHKIDARLGSAYELDLEDASIDLATSNGVFHELSQPHKALDEMKRVLKPRGYVIITDFRDTVLGRRIAAVHREDDHGPFSPEELRALLEHAGFLNVEVDVVRHWLVAVGQKHQ